MAAKPGGHGLSIYRSEPFLPVDQPLASSRGDFTRATERLAPRRRRIASCRAALHDEAVVLGHTLRGGAAGEQQSEVQAPEVLITRKEGTWDQRRCRLRKTAGYGAHDSSSLLAQLGCQSPPGAWERLTWPVLGEQRLLRARRRPFHRPPRQRTPRPPRCPLRS